MSTSSFFAQLLPLVCKHDYLSPTSSFPHTVSAPWLDHSNSFFKNTSLEVYVEPCQKNTVTFLKYHCRFYQKGEKSSRSQRLFKIGVIGVLKNLANFKGKHLCWSLLLKRGSNTGVFL